MVRIPKEAAWEGGTGPALVSSGPWPFGKESVPDRSGLSTLMCNSLSPSPFFSTKIYVSTSHYPLHQSQTAG